MSDNGKPTVKFWIVAALMFLMILGAFTTGWWLMVRSPDAWKFVEDIEDLE